MTTNNENGIAALISLVIPGGGHIYKGRLGSGLLWLGCTFLGYLALFFPGIILHLISVIKAFELKPRAGSLQ